MVAILANCNIVKIWPRVKTVCNIYTNNFTLRALELACIRRLTLAPMAINACGKSSWMVYTVVNRGLF